MNKEYTPKSNSPIFNLVLILYNKKPLSKTVFGDILKYCKPTDFLSY